MVGVGARILVPENSATAPPHVASAERSQLPTQLRTELCQWLSESKSEALIGKANWRSRATPMALGEQKRGSPTKPRPVVIRKCTAPNKHQVQSSTLKWLSESGPVVPAAAADQGNGRSLKEARARCTGSRTLDATKENSATAPPHVASAERSQTARRGSGSGERRTSTVAAAQLTMGCEDGQDCAGVFVAQYQFQHELPAGMLEQQGLHGCLLQDATGLRFFSGAEIAAVHGAVQPVLLLASRHDQMRLLGNAIAVPHAAAALAQACRLMRCPGAPDMMLATQWCLADRLRCSTTALIPVTTGWILCRQDQIPEVIQTLQVSEPDALQVDGPEVFVEVLFHTPGQDVATSLAAPAGLPVARLIGATGNYRNTETGFDALPKLPSAAATCLQVPGAPSLNMSGFIGGSGVQSGLCTVLTHATVYLVDHSGPRSWSQLLHVFRALDPDHDPNCCLGVYSLSGQRLTDHKTFGSCIVALSEDEDVPAFSLRQLAAHVSKVAVFRQDDTVCFRGPSCAAGDLWMGFPFQLLSALGWGSEIEGLPPRDHVPVAFRLQPLQGRPIMPADLLHNQCRVWLFISQVEDNTCSIGEPAIEVEIQLLACRLWIGRLPGATTLQNISDWWQCASVACALPGRHRVFSGPHPHDPAATIAEVAAQTTASVIRKTGHLLVTIQPQIIGGGVKDENVQLAKTKVATLLLDRGVSLPETSVTADNLVPKLGSAACLKILSGTDTAQQWLELKNVASTVGVPLPQGDNRTEKAAKRLQRAVRRRRLTGSPEVRACDFTLEEGSWVGIDGAPAAILQTASHNSEGVLLLDAREATSVDLDLLRNIESDALCVVIPGHDCPDPESCCGTISVPARHRASGQTHLLAACYHNVGSTNLEPHVQHGTDITVTGTTCCTFSMHSSDFAQEEWQEVVRAPVRTAAEAFRKAGVHQAFNDPWSRQYRCDGRPSQPHLSDTCSFNAKVTTALLRPLLQQSGFNSVFLIPKTWDRQLLPGWSVVWLTGDKTDSAKQAGLIAEQHGLVRSRARFGVRVPVASFDKVFRQLRPGMEPPVSVTVKTMFKAGPFPAGTTADDIVAWAAKLQWPAKALKSLGPTFWLLGAESQPPAQTTRFNSTPVLISEVKGREQKRPVIQAGGPLPQPQPAAQSSPDPWLENDPWSQYKATTAVMRPPSIPGPAPRSTSSAAPPLDHHLAGRMHTTESRLAELEQNLQALRDDQLKAAAERQQDRVQTASEIQSVRGEVQSLGASLQLQLQSNLDGLRNAQSQQEQQMNSGMQELKALILACHENKKARTCDHDL
ncbi:unnamed protein product [Symbiodinium sp. CCMP2592]|nr:unnamed protein product [Symbiodinium sp. CCMP2592]